MSTTTQNSTKKRKRAVCYHCKRQKAVCICAALPSTNLPLTHARVIVLEHPQETKRKDRSLPLIELCLQKYMDVTSDESSERTDCQAHVDFGICTHVCRRLGSQIPKPIYNILHDKHEIVFLMYPSEDAIPLREALNHVKSLNKSFHSDDNDDYNVANKKINLIFLDATWKFAKEMDTKTIQAQAWPKHMIRVKLDATDFGSDFQPRRFDYIRTPPNDDYLSTAECIARTLEIVENDKHVFETLMKPLDLMVMQWKSFEEQRTLPRQRNALEDKV
jgi:DTW domain-containing protein YfiP